MKGPLENFATLNIWSRNVTTSTREPRTFVCSSAEIWRQDGAICSKNKNISHIIGARGSQDLRSLSAIMAPDIIHFPPRTRAKMVGRQHVYRKSNAKWRLHVIQAAFKKQKYICFRWIHVDCRTFYPLSECAPSKSFHVLSFGEQVFYPIGLRRSGFVCRTCRPGPYLRCFNCSLCAAGFYNDIDGLYGSCLLCPPGNLEYNRVYWPTNSPSWSELTTWSKARPPRMYTARQSIPSSFALWETIKNLIGRRSQSGANRFNIHTFDKF